MSRNDEDLEPTAWRQIGGDMSWSSVGCLLARMSPRGDYVELHQITPWVELDSSAIGQGYGLYNYQSTDLPVEDLVLTNKDMKSALQSTGVTEEEFEGLSPMGKAQLYVEGGYGYESDHSTSHLLEALPAKPEEITFWGGKETEESVLDDEMGMRRDCLEHMTETRLGRGELPDEEALEFVMGGQDFEVELGDNGKAALGYAALFSKIPGKVDGRTDVAHVADAEDMLAVLAALDKAAAMTGEELVPHDVSKLRGYLGHGGKGDAEEEEIREAATELAGSATELADEILGSLGFSR